MNNMQNEIIRKWITNKISVMPSTKRGIWLLINEASKYNSDASSEFAEKVLKEMYGEEWANEVLTAALDLKPEPEPN